MTVNYDEAVAGIEIAMARTPDADKPLYVLEVAQVHATLAVADQLRALYAVLIEVVGYTGTPGRAFLRVFDEAP